MPNRLCEFCKRVASKNKYAMISFTQKNKNKVVEYKSQPQFPKNENNSMKVVDTNGYDFPPTIKIIEDIANGSELRNVIIEQI